MTGLTPVQSRILDFIIQHIESKHVPPTIKEIGVAMNIQSNNGVHEHLTRLRVKGYIATDPFKSRSIRVLKHSQGYPVRLSFIENPFPSERQHR